MLEYIPFELILIIIKYHISYNELIGYKGDQSCIHILMNYIVIPMNQCAVINNEDDEEE